MAYSEQIADFLDFLRDCEQEYRIFSSQESDANAETQDLLHCLELQENSYHDMAKISKMLRQIRKERRSAKKKEEQLAPIVDWAVQNRKTIYELEKLLGAVRKAEKSTESREYRPKTDVLSRTLGNEWRSAS